MKKLIGMLLAGVFAVTATSSAWAQSHRSDRKMRKSDKKAMKAAGKPAMGNAYSYYGYNGHKTKTKTYY